MSKNLKNCPLIWHVLKYATTIHTLPPNDANAKFYYSNRIEHGLNQITNEMSFMPLGKSFCYFIGLSPVKSYQIRWQTYAHTDAFPNAADSDRTQKAYFSINDQFPQNPIANSVLDLIHENEPSKMCDIYNATSQSNGGGEYNF